MSAIVNINGREILDSRGRPTLEVEVILESGFKGLFSVPSGASTGKHEATELRDNDLSRYAGLGVKKAISFVNTEIFDTLSGRESTDQKAIDSVICDLDGTKNKCRLGANSILGVSMAIARASAKEHNLELYRYIGGVNANVLPVPMLNIINGGMHSNNSLDIQEFMIMPVGASTFTEAIRWSAEVFYSLEGLLSAEGYSNAKGDEGGFAPNLNSNEEALDYIVKSIEKSGYKVGEDFFISLDIAASSFFNNGCYKFGINNKKLSSDELIDVFKVYVEKYPIFSIEDPLSEDDLEGWKKITEILGEDIQIVGDDLFVTSEERLANGINNKLANAILIKLNQIGTLSESLETINLAQNSSYRTVVSHRSGETEDVSISDLAVATSSGQIKTGSLSRSERVAKYNRLLKIENELGGTSIYIGKGLLK